MPRRVYYRSGDIAHGVGECYIFDARAFIDLIKTPAGPVPVQKIERALSRIPSAETAYAVPVPDEEKGQRVSVICAFMSESSITSLRDGLSRQDITAKVTGT
ncbi:uncharacterized protein BDV17DRAFT_268799 [Aspergillus undulatus]|uniref:uncharacterized protein n=1 Tax=Aspergillus undulatus TaxID=1810928 RepID=UPI003CCD1E16